MRKVTEEQKQRAKEKRQKLREYAKAISKMNEAERDALVQSWPTTIEGRALSMHNACLLACQGGATIVGGFRQWIKAGRCVRKGEHGKSIWIPLGYTKKTDDNGEITQEGEKTGFGLATVFDISQTREFNAAIESDAAEIALPSLDTVRNGAPALELEVA